MNTVRTLQIRYQTAKARTAGWRDPILDALREVEEQYKESKDNEKIFSDAISSDFIEIEVRILKKT